jgi:hypothetical protein
MIALNVPYKSMSHFYVLKLYLQHHINNIFNFEMPTPYHTDASANPFLKTRISAGVSFFKRPELDD